LNDIEALEEKLSSGEFAVVIIEGIQGVAGIRMVEDEFLRRLREVTKKYGTLLILDEIQSGYGRTGKFFAHQYTGVRPDIITCAKGIANGFPMGAILIAPHIEAKKGMLGTTFGGNHLACAAAIAVLDVMADEKLVENAAEIGEYILTRLNEAAKTEPKIKDVRGRGLMIGIEIEGSAPELRKRLLFEDKIFTGGAGEHTVRLLPALCITKEHADRFLDTFMKFL
ncbi:MAG: aminotransferase class III-fold pyridoxal phosphate-dependent enzyme, partial [Duncaniella sp.]|nr:aminotransferase class III-fold pyridoxal phosphate-dependent enzyme [Duncaniella sp.]